ncbi:hypothetical protein ABEU20_003822 [Rhodococcus sp. PAM 2766]|uniref:Uncharacterized protein n=1 Tax=Rhodococcus parequi TaxID=3137122 RepID=A0ABW9FI11_9NOCA
MATYTLEKAEKTTLSPSLNLPVYAIAWLSCIGMVVGSIGPWATGGGHSMAGTEGDGRITLALAIAAALALTVRAVRQHVWAVAVPMVASVVVLVVAIADLTNLDELLGALSSFFSISIGWGLWLLLASAAGLAVSAFALTVSTASARGITRQSFRAEFQEMSAVDRLLMWFTLVSCIITAGLLSFLVCFVSAGR